MNLLRLGIEKVKENISFEQKKTLLEKLDSAGFKITNLGHVLLIDIKCPKEGHPMGTNDYLPVGKITHKIQETNGDLNNSLYSPFDLDLVNLDKKFPLDYHSTLRDIFNSL